MMLYSQTQSDGYILLTWSNQDKTIKGVDQCNTLWERKTINIPVN